VALIAVRGVSPEGDGCSFFSAACLITRPYVKGDMSDRNTAPKDETPPKGSIS
jgi:hypothetical protein